jgi:hypothetical protein
MKGLLTANQVKKTAKNCALLDILVIFSILLILGAFAYMILNPSKKQSDMRNLKRNIDITTMMQLLATYVDTTGNIPNVIPLNRECASVGNEVCKTDASDCITYVDLSEVLGKETVLPVDELRDSSENGTGYYISHDGEGSILICAPLAERNVNVTVKQFMY